ncbi:MAG: DMT family transporter [Pseudomonadota bacterium]
MTPARSTLLAQARAASPLLKAVLLVVTVTFFFSCMDSAAKALSERYEPFFVVWARYVVQAVLVTLLLAPRLGRLARTKQLGLQILRSSLLFAATMMFFYGFSVMKLADVIAVAQVSPLAITAMAALLLGERVGPWRWLGVGLGFIGALVILRPGLGEAGWTTLYPLGGALFFAAYGVSTRALGPDENPWTTFFYTGLVGAIVASLAAPFLLSAGLGAEIAAPGADEASWRVDALLFLAAGVFGALGQGVLILAFSLAPASLLAPYFYSGLLWSILFGYVLFGEWPDAFTFAGAAIILGAGLFVQWRERRAAAPAAP